MDNKKGSFFCKQHCALLKVLWEKKKHLLEITYVIHKSVWCWLSCFIFHFLLDNWCKMWNSIPVNHFWRSPVVSELMVFPDHLLFQSYFIQCLYTIPLYVIWMVISSNSSLIDLCILIQKMVHCSILIICTKINILSEKKKKRVWQWIQEAVHQNSF